MRLRFNFEVEKLVQAIAYLSNMGVSGLDKLKIAKLLFLADKQHLLTVGRPILGDWYSCMPYGPVPSQSLNVINDVIEADPATPPAGEHQFDEYLAIDRTRQHPAFNARKEPNLDVFSESEIEVLNAVVREFGRYTGSELIGLTHNDPIWAIPDKNRGMSRSVEIPFELFFEVNGAADMLEFARLQQENRDFEMALSFEADRAN